MFVFAKFRGKLWRQCVVVFFQYDGYAVTSQITIKNNTAASGKFKLRNDHFTFKPQSEISPKKPANSFRKPLRAIPLELRLFLREIALSKVHCLWGYWADLVWFLPVYGLLSDYIQREWNAAIKSGSISLLRGNLYRKAGFLWRLDGGRLEAWVSCLLCSLVSSLALLFSSFPVLLLSSVQIGVSSFRDVCGG